MRLAAEQNPPFPSESEIADAGLGLAVALIFVITGIMVIWALYPANPFISAVGIALLIMAAAFIVVRFVKSYG